MTSGRDQKELTGVSLLGNKTKYPTDYAPEVLDRKSTRLNSSH